MTEQARPGRLGPLLACLVLLMNLSHARPAEGPAPPADATASSAVFCPVCGAENQPGSKFCLKDGTPLPTLEAERYQPGFVRAPETLSAGEIQSAIQQAAKSVVRVRVKTKTDFRYPAVNDFGYGYMAEMKDERRLIGSGFAVEQGGWVVTNAHVASPFGAPAELSLDAQDGRNLPCRLIGIDVASDLALLRAEGSDLPAVAWGDSEKVQLGEEVWALGIPLDIGLSLTRGTVASMVRVHVGLNQVENFLHSDAFFTSGNSGGPLVSVRGTVLGVNDMGYFREKGQGYSIPSRMAKLVIDRLRQKGAYARGFLGLQVRPIDSEMIKKYSLHRTGGVVVESILAGTPAETAGFKPGDVIFGINNHALPDSYVLQEAISSVGPAAAIQLVLDRGGREIPIDVTTTARPAWPRIDPVQDLERYLHARFIDDPKKKKVVIQTNDLFSLASFYGFADGDRVESVLPAAGWTETLLSPEVYRASHPTEVRTVSDLREALKRMYEAGRLGVAFGLRTDRARPNEPLVHSLVLEETWALIV
ncbi:MAG TPA: trypsin-like peptidase domain-containing protein [Candidatus Polarisedimenticolia bacterium]|nr:trypsin-like peptidase domain-containing protein [Candidatus Polarisedimenticolia bacterium]